MSRYKFQDNQNQSNKRTEVHPVWRGVGFLMLVLIPVISYASTEVLIAQNKISKFFPWPTDIYAKPGELLFNGDPLLYLKIVLTIAFIFLFYAIFTLVTVIVNRAFGAPRYGPLDVPPIDVKVRRKSR